MITVSPNAADRIKKIQDETKASDKSVRIAVVGGGCSGPQYQMGFDVSYDGDSTFQTNGVTVVVDNQSLPLLDGTEIDYVDGAHGSTFVFNNPNTIKSGGNGGCGCGKSGC